MRKLEPTTIREIARAIASSEGASNRMVASMAGISPSTVFGYREEMARQGLAPADILAMDDDGLVRAFGDSCRMDRALVEPDWDGVLEYLGQPLPHRKGRRSLRDAWFWRYVLPGIADPVARERASLRGYIPRGELPAGLMSLSTFKRRAKEERARRCPGLDKGLYDGRSEPCGPGEQAMIDASGDPLCWEDPSGAAHSARVLVGVLPYSGLLFMDAEPDTTTQSWIRFVIGMVRYFGGVPGSILSDNENAKLFAMAKSCVQRPEFQGV